MLYNNELWARKFMLLVVREVSVEIKTVFYKYEDDYFLHNYIHFFTR